MYPSFHDWRMRRREESNVSQPANISSTLSKSTYLPSHAVSSTAPFDDLTARHVCFLYTHGSPSTNQQSFSSQQHPASLSRHFSEPNIRSVTAQPASHYPISDATETRYHQQRQRQQHRPSFQLSVTPVIPPPRSASFSVDRSPSAAGSAASSGWEPHADTCVESLQEITAVTPAHGLYASIGILVDPSK